jgi:hypothetical protein
VKAERGISIALTPEYLKIKSASMQSYRIDAGSKETALFGDFNVPDEISVSNKAVNAPWVHDLAGAFLPKSQGSITNFINSQIFHN